MILRQFRHILTYEEGEQEILETCVPLTFSEEEFVLDCFGPANETSELLKISSDWIGAIAKSGRKMTAPECGMLGPPTYLIANKGQYFFNTDENDDSDTTRWKAFRDEYVVEWRKTFEKKDTETEERSFKEQFYRAWLSRQKSV